MTTIEKYTQQAAKTLISTGQTMQAVSTELNRWRLGNALASAICASAKCEVTKKALYQGKERAVPVPRPVDVGTCDPDSLHCLTGLLGEVGELAEALVCPTAKASEDDVMSELGDVLYYLTMLCECTGNSLEEVMKANNAKLAARHGVENDG